MLDLIQHLRVGLRIDFLIMFLSFVLKQKKQKFKKTLILPASRFFIKIYG
jgi:hypothetical protein